MMMRAVDVLYSLPDILLIVILMALFERSLLLLFRCARRDLLAHDGPDRPWPGS